MKILIKNGVVVKYPYYFHQLQQDNPQVSFPETPTEELLMEWGVYPVTQVSPPSIDYTQNLTEGTPVEQNGQWIQVWTVTDASAEEIAQRELQRQQQLEAQRSDAYRIESDPLFFKAQRGEATMEEWLAKVAEIKARYQ